MSKKEFGPGPFEELQPLIDRLEDELSSWINNVPQHAPESPEEAEEWWDLANAAAIDILSAAEALERRASEGYSEWIQ